MFNLWPHQQQALDFMIPMLETKGYAALFMGVGTGKTAVTLSYIDRELDQGPVLVITKQRPGYVWKRDVDKFFPGMSVIEAYSGTLAERVELINSIADSKDRSKFLVVINYDILSYKGIQRALDRVKWSMIVADEAQHLKSHKSAQSRYAHKLGKRGSPKRLALTATPFHNKPLDIFGVARFLSDSIFGTGWTKFRYQYATWYGPYGYVLGTYINQDDLRRRVDEFAFYIDRKEVLNLPEVKHSIRWLEFTPTEKKNYKELEKESILELESGVITADNPLTSVLRLKQFTGGMMDASGVRHVTSNVKAQAVLELLDELPEDEPVVVYYSFTAEVDLIRQTLEKHKYTCAELSGKMDQRKEWENGDYQILLVQLAAGAEGIDLYHAAYAVYYSLPWSYGQYEQSMGRLDRPGQERKVQFIYLLIRGTIDEDIRKSLKKKDASAKDILDNMRSRYENIHNV